MAKAKLFARRARLQRRWWARRQSEVTPLPAVSGAFAHLTGTIADLRIDKRHD